MPALQRTVSSTERSPRPLETHGRGTFMESRRQFCMVGLAAERREHDHGHDYAVASGIREYALRAANLPATDGNNNNW
jgi:hypothetical protein